MDAVSATSLSPLGVPHQNPYAVFAVTDSADFTEDERNRRRMKGHFTSLEMMKKQLPSNIERDAVAALESYSNITSLDSDDKVPPLG